MSETPIMHPTNNHTAEFIRDSRAEGAFPPKQELIQDPNEAHEVAFATKELEEEFHKRIGRIASSLELDGSGNITPESNEAYQIDDEFVIWNDRLTRNTRHKANELGSRVSEAYKNGAEFLDLSSDKFSQVFAEAPIYRKSTLVKARNAEAGEVVVTVTPDGVEEGRNTAGEDDYVVTGANGADFILPGGKFNKLYGATEDEGVFQAKGMARITDNPTGKKIGILAPWGEMQYGDENSKLAVQFDPENPDVVGADRYVLDSNEFAVYKEA